MPLSVIHNNYKHFSSGSIAFRLRSAYNTPYEQKSIPWQNRIYLFLQKRVRFLYSARGSVTLHILCTTVVDIFYIYRLECFVHALFSHAGCRRIAVMRCIFILCRFSLCQSPFFETAFWNTHFSMFYFQYVRYE